MPNAEGVQLQDEFAAIEMEYNPLFTLNGLLEDWKAGRRCDVLLYGQERKTALPCQSNMLIAIGAYFRAYFERWNNGKLRKPIEELYLDEIPEKVIRTLLEIAFTGRMKAVSSCTLVDLIKGAVYLEMDGLRRGLCETLEKTDDLSAWVCLFLSPEHCDKEMIIKAGKEIRRSFDKVIQCHADLLMDLTKNQWIDLLSDDNLFVSDENKLLNVVSDWVTCLPEYRSIEFLEISRHFRTGCLNKGIFDSDGSERHAIVQDFINTLSELKTEHTHLFDCCDKKFHPRTMEVLLAFKQYPTPFAEPKYTLLSSGDPNFSHFPIMSLPRFTFSVTSPDNIVYIDAFPRVFALDPCNGERILTGDRKSLYLGENDEELCDIARLAYLDGSIFFIRKIYGDPANCTYQELNCLNVQTKKLTQIAMPSCHGHPPFILGHETGLYFFQQDTYYVYCHQCDTWSSSMQLPNNFFNRQACVGPNGFIYLLGVEVNDSVDPKVTEAIGVDKLDPIANKWSPCATPSCSFHNAMLFHLNGNITLIDSDHSPDCPYHVEIYDDDKDCWILRDYQIPHELKIFPASVARVTVADFKRHLHSDE